MLKVVFSLQKKSKKSAARLGVLKTSHGEIETPFFVPVATQATVKTLTSEDAAAAGCQILIANTYHLHLKPGEKIIKANGGLHKFMNWPRPLMTDSGGFQVFSLGFGNDLGVGKMIKQKQSVAHVQIGDQPQNLKITDKGVWFKSPIDGRKILIGPNDSMKIQAALGADIIFAFDECTPPSANYEYTKQSLEKTHRWALQSLQYKSKKQALFGIVQGGKFKDLRKESAKFIGAQPFDGFGIGGEFGDSKTKMVKMIDWVNKNLPENKPRHLLGIGHPEDILKIIKAGVDTFDCIAPTHYARRGFAFIGSYRHSRGSGNLEINNADKLDLNKKDYLRDKKPLDEKCDCRVCQNYNRSYIHHLLRAKEITSLSLLTFHNLYFFNKMVEKIREEIKKGKI